MSAAGNILLNKGIPDNLDAFIVLVKTEWNAHICDRLEDGAINIFIQKNIASKTIIVPGAFELPFAVKNFHLNAERKPDAYIVFGSVIRGDTPHFDYVCQGVTHGVVLLNQTIDVPTIFGVLTVDNEEQAVQRIGGIHGHKGEEAAFTAIKMIELMRSIK